MWQGTFFFFFYENRDFSKIKQKKGMKWPRKLVFKNFGMILSIVLAKNDVKLSFFGVLLSCDSVSWKLIVSKSWITIKFMMEDVCCFFYENI